MASSGKEVGNFIDAAEPHSGASAVNLAWRRRWPTFGLRQGVLLSMALLFIVVLSVLGVGISTFSTNLEKEAWYERQLESTIGAWRAVGNFLNHHTKTLESLGLLDAEYLRSHPALLTASIQQNSALLEVVVVDSAGEIIASAQGASVQGDAPALLVSTHIEDTQWFSHARAGSVYLGNVQMTASDEAYLLLATPSPTGNVVAARISIGSLREVVSQARFGKSGAVFLMDRAGNIIVHSQFPVNFGELALGFTPAQTEKLDHNGVLILRAEIDERTGLPYWHKEYNDFAGTAVSGVLVSLLGTEWYVVSEMATSETIAVSRLALIVLGVSLLGFALLVLGAGRYVLDRWLFAPIALLRQGAHWIGAGHLDHRIAMAEDNEIGQLGKAFNEMAAHLQSRQQQVTDQTAVLNAEVEQRRGAQMALQEARDALEATVAARMAELQVANRQLSEQLVQHQQAQAALATVEARLRHLLLTSPAIIFSIRLEGEPKINYISDNIAEATGYRPEEYYNDPRFAYQHIHPDDMAHVTQQLERLGQDERVSYEYRFRVSSGEYRWFHDDAVAVYDEVGGVREIVGSLIDIDERKRIEEEQAAIRDQALEASRLKSEFLATVSHEIRTPLNGVIGMADLLLATGLTDEQRDFVKTIAYSADSLLVVINDVLDLSKVEAGKLTLLESEFAPTEVAQSVASLLLPRAREKGIALNVEMGAELPKWVRGYEARLRQVLLNLMGNAVKFTEQGSVTLRATVVSREGEHSSRLIRFTVSDTGIGLDSANFVKLFQPFSQVESSLARRYGGAGLGLAISKQLVELMGGEIGVRSEAGRGSDFWFTVPLYPADGVLDVALDGELGAKQAVERAIGGDESTCAQEGTAMPPVRELALPLTSPPEQKAAYPSSAAPSSATIVELLLVEDNLVNQKVALAQLKRMGYGVTTVMNGREAVEAVQQHTYAAVLMDCQMPEMDGFEATRLIRAWQRRIGRRVPIIAMTANAMNGDREACLAAGMDDYIPKPIRTEELQRVLQKWTEVEQPK
jgi:PAS domain S-box-containing protein